MFLVYIISLCVVVINNYKTQQYTINKEQHTISYSIDGPILDNEYYLNLTLNTSNYCIFSQPMNLTNITIKGNIYVKVPNVDISLFFHPSLKQTVQLSLVQIDITYHGQSITHSLMQSPGKLQILNSQIRFDFNVVSLEGSLLLKNANNITLSLLNTQLYSSIKSNSTKIGIITSNITKFNPSFRKVTVQVNYSVQQKNQSVIDLFVASQQPATSVMQEIKIQNNMMSKLIYNKDKCYCYHNQQSGQFVGIECDQTQCNQNPQ